MRKSVAENHGCVGYEQTIPDTSWFENINRRDYTGKISSKIKVMLHHGEATTASVEVQLPHLTERDILPFLPECTILPFLAEREILPCLADCDILF